jgi:uncharacterized protein
MHVEHHPLIAEFPEYRDAIHDRKQSDAHFAKLFAEYETIDKAVVRAENGIEHLGDLALEELKKQRLALKDTLYNTLRGA